MSKRSAKSSKTFRKVAPAKKDHFDQEDEDLDILQMEEHKDAEYNGLLKSSPHANLKKNAHFFNDPRYSGAKKHQLQEDDEQEQQVHEQNEDEEPEDEQNQIRQALLSLKSERKRKVQLLHEDIKKIQEEDEQFETLRKKQKTSEENIQESLKLKNQLQLYKDLVDVRYHKQNQLESLKRYPNRNYPESQQLNGKQKEFEGQLLNNLNQLINTYYSYANKVYNLELNNTFEQELAEQEENGANREECRLNIEALHAEFTSNQEDAVKEAEKELVKWSQKTNLINISSSHYSSLMMQTPVGQAKKVVAGWDRVAAKAQTKRGTFRILFEQEDNVKIPTDKQIFDDFDLFTELERIYIAEVEDDNDFRISDTLRYLRNRESRGEKIKQVDRKASKNRKIRFNVHPKLLNFMPSKPENLIEARDEIVENIFNCRSQLPQAQNNQQEETYYIDI